jgi:hypothetical protein
MSTRRAPGYVWIAVLKRIVPILTLSNVSDLILFGSQAMSVYMERALASKDIDLIAPGMTEATLEKISKEVAQISAQTPTYDHVVTECCSRRYPVSHIYLRHRSGFPFVIEFFDNFIGYDRQGLIPLSIWNRNGGWSSKFSYLKQ